MHHFRYVKGRLHCEGSSIEALVEQYGSPLYVYSSQTLSDHYTRLSQSLSELDHSICYAVKANSNLGVLHTLANLGSGLLLSLGFSIKILLFECSDGFSRNIRLSGD